VAPSKPLSLRRQKSRAASSRHKELGGLTLQADVFVETDVFHLDQTFSYVIPEDLVDSIQSGSIVKVPFKEREVLGVITAVKPIENVGLRPVSKALLPSA
jgi:primosomal protein N' (replication factor Y)